ncbi:hypothetical protein ACFE04_018380 [Oxalis oulophora]
MLSISSTNSNFLLLLGTISSCKIRSPEIVFRSLRSRKFNHLARNCSTTTVADAEPFIVSDDDKYGNKQIISITHRLYDYILSNVREPQILRQLREETATMRGSQMQVSPDQAQLLSMLVQILGAQRCIELGVYTGYSSLAIALVLPETGCLVACERDARPLEIARKYYELAGVSHKVIVKHGLAADVLNSLILNGEASSFDFAFVDAEKRMNQEYFELLLKLVRVGGVIVIDNVLWHGKVADPTVNDAKTVSIRNFNKSLMEDKRVSISLDKRSPSTIATVTSAMAEAHQIFVYIFDDAKEEEEEEGDKQLNESSLELLNDDRQNDEESEILDDIIISKATIHDDQQQALQSEKKPNMTMLRKSVKLTKLIRLKKLAAHKAKKALDVELAAGPAVLQVDPMCLNYESEMRRIFASKVVKSFDKSNPGSSKHIRQCQGSWATDFTGKKTYLVSPSENWPPWDDSLSMEYLETKGGCHYFRYVHSSSYGEVQKAFEAKKAIRDFEGIAHIIRKHPYHIDSLLTITKLLRPFDEPDMIKVSQDSILKSLYALESAWHPKFTPFQANCQLKCSEETNEPLFEALFIYKRNLDWRGCHRSALEVCKLLLSLDSADPRSTIFCIDYYALKAEEYQWLEKFSEEYNTNTSLWFIPNFPYSLAICRHYLESMNDSQLDSMKSSSADLMKQALMLYPPVLKKLVAKIPLKDQAWTHIIENPIFRSDQTHIPPLDHLIGEYVERNYLLWRFPDLQKLLQDSALFVIESMERGKYSAEDWARVRKETFSAERTECRAMSVGAIDSASTILPDNVEDCKDPEMSDFVVDPRMTHGSAENRDKLAALLELMIPWPGNSEE